MEKADADAHAAMVFMRAQKIGLAERRDEAAGVVYYTARSGDNWMKVQLHRVGLDGKGDVRLTDPAFHHTIGGCVTGAGGGRGGFGGAAACGISPDNKYFVDVYQTHDTPPSTRLVDVATGKAVADLAPGDWILIGWGDAAFYVDQSPISDRLPDGARAFFRPGNPSVVMLDPESLDPRDRHAADRRAALRLPPGAFDRMAGRIESSLDLADGGPRVATARAGDDARSLVSRESFSILHLCNHWTAGALNAGGVAIRPARSAFSGEVMRSVRAAELDRAAPHA